MDLKGKVVVVTGASMGIGEEIAKSFAAAGASVVMSSRDAARVEQARARIGSQERTSAAACDVCDRAQVRALVDATLARHGRIDVWVNNAGYGLMDSVAEMDMRECRRMFDTNLFGAIECMQAVTPVMQKQGGGAIINISSIAGHIAVPYMSAYGATKHALNCISTAARVELKKHNIHVLTVCPGYIATDFAVNAVRGPNAMRMGAAAKRGISADRVARAVLDAYRKRKRMIVVPWRDWLFVWFYRLLPKVMERGMERMLRPAGQVIAEVQAAKRS
jgi:short-subunit dehydrogenase